MADNYLEICHRLIGLNGSRDFSIDVTTGWSD